MKAYFFGVISKGSPGHYLYDRHGSRVYSTKEIREMPVHLNALDALLLTQPEEQGRPHIAVINGWTVLGMWDRTGDERFGSNASFIFEGVHDLEEMKFLAATDFPALWSRIQRPTKK